MSTEESPCERARQELIRLLENDEWTMTESARGDWMRSYRRRFRTECAVIDYILGLLRRGCRLNEPTLGSGEASWSMNNTDGEGLYIKLKIYEERAVVLSFHLSKHHRGG
jgi:hypothetical protein